MHFLCTDFPPSFQALPSCAGSKGDYVLDIICQFLGMLLTPKMFSATGITIRDVVIWKYKLIILKYNYLWKGWKLIYLYHSLN